MRKKLQNFGQYAREYSQYAKDGLIELSQHPVKYTSKALKDLVKDYWDAGVAITSGLMLSDYGKEILGDHARIPLYISGGLVSLVAPLLMDRQENADTRQARFARNAAALFGAPQVASGYIDKDTTSLYFGMLPFSFAALFEYMRRVRKNTSIANPTIHKSLENKLTNAT